MTGQAPAANRCRGLTQGERLRMGRRVLAQLALVARRGHHLTAPRDDGTDWELLVLGGRSGLLQCQRHHLPVHAPRFHGRSVEARRGNFAPARVFSRGLVPQIRKFLIPLLALAALGSPCLRQRRRPMRSSCA